MNRWIGLGLQAAILACSTSAPILPAAGDTPPPPPSPSPVSTARHYVLISDLHFGPGRREDGSWDPIDDFRWPRALRGFLDYISTWGHDEVDLVILGDFFELWQHPEISCASVDPDFGCTTLEMKKVVKRILGKHHPELESLWAFAEKGRNRLVVVPGNHDAALLSDAIWEQVSQSIGHPNARVRRSTDGYWSSEDGFILGEHGHQIGIDVSGFGGLWPAGFRRDASAAYPRPWGQLFVESFFDTAEITYPIIDNVIPQSKGVAMLLQGQTVAADASQVARFLAFNAVRTSLKQKVVLNIPTPESQSAALTETHGWDVSKGRSLGYKLFADALPDGDWWRDELLGGEGAYWNSVREELKAIAGNANKLTTPQVVTLCDRISLLAKEQPETKRATCSSELALSVASSVIPEATILASHLNDLRPTYPNAGIFVYGHTHEMAMKFNIKLKGGRSIDVLNTGAFQRLTDVESLKVLQTDRHLSTDLDVLKLSSEDLKPCYSAVLIEYHGRDPDPVLKYWYMAEEDNEGKLLDPCDAKCPRIAKKCGG